MKMKRMVLGFPIFFLTSQKKNGQTYKIYSNREM